MVLQDAAGCNMVLVDHSEYMQSAEGLQDANIISIIDHHADGTITTAGQLIYDARPLGSTSTIIWMRYRDYGVTPDRQTALVMMGSILSDTKSDTAVHEEIWYKIEPYASRKKVVVPAITNVLKAHPMENT